MMNNLMGTQDGPPPTDANDNLFTIGHT